MTDRDTIAIYDARAQDYAEMTDAAARIDPALQAFVARLPAGARVLDLGCGPGTAAAEMARAGLEVEAVDASHEMVALAARHQGVKARVARFEEIGGTGMLDGIWANFSLLHAPREDMPGHLARLHRALKPGGIFHIGVKLGAGAGRDGLGRFYTYYGEDELAGLLEAAGFAIESRWHGRDPGLDGSVSDWVCLLARAAGDGG